LHREFLKPRRKSRGNSEIRLEEEGASVQTSNHGGKRETGISHTMGYNYWVNLSP